MSTTRLENPSSDAPPISVPIRACRYWEDTGFCLAEGQDYIVEVSFPQSQADPDFVWDADIPVSNLNGWPSSFKRSIFTPLLFWTRRRPFEPWFALIATVNRQRPFRIATSPERFTAPATGQLVCFFNDLPFAYGNNRGAARLSLTPAPAANNPDQ